MANNILKIVICCGCFVFWGCRLKSKTITINGQIISVDSIKPIPIPTHQEIHNAITRAFLLDSITKSEVGLEVRIFRAYASIQKVLLFVISENNGKWSGYKTSLEIEYYPKENKVRYLPQQRDTTSPTLGWKGLGEKIIQLGILDFSDSDSIPNYVVPSDPDGVSVQIANTGKYRFYEMLQPDYNLGIKDAESMCNVLRTIEDDLEFRGFYLKRKVE